MSNDGSRNSNKEIKEHKNITLGGTCKLKQFLNCLAATLIVFLTSRNSKIKITLRSATICEGGSRVACVSVYVCVWGGGGGASIK